ncbi:MAG: hypothetical protein ACE5G7_00495 [Candidatus Hydrothermarchaeaceae archaeon]
MNHLEKELAKFFRSYAEVTFVDLKRSFPNHFDKRPGKDVRKNKKLAWKGLSSEMADSLNKLLREGVVELVEIPEKRYSLEGYEIKEKNWVPMALAFRREILDHAI